MPTWTDPALGPSASVLVAFAAGGARLAPLSGGQGRSWLADAPGSAGAPARRLVLKPVHDALEASEVAWLAEHLRPLVPSERGGRLRLATPVASTDGRWVVQGWSASTWLAGREGPRGRWREVLATAEVFHATLAHLPRPLFLDQRTHRWARADRAAWGEAHLSLHPDAQVLAAPLHALAAATRGEHGPGQLIHGDLSGNILFDDHPEGSGHGRVLAPAVIDMAPYWRPAAYAGAIVVIDALLWWGQDAGLLLDAGPSAAPDLLARALLFRLIDHHEAQREAGCRHDQHLTGLQPYRRALTVLANAP